jgi:hypothetical protein
MLFPERKSIFQRTANNACQEAAVVESQALDGRSGLAKPGSPHTVIPLNEEAFTDDCTNT